MTPFYESPQKVEGEPQVRIFHGRWEDVWPTLGLNPADVALCWADPPYGIRLVTKHGARGAEFRGRKRNVSASHRPVIGDNAPFDPTALLVFSRLATWGANHYANRLPSSPSWWWWDKLATLSPTDTGDGEMAWTNIGGPVRRFIHMWKGMCQASEKGGDITGERLHPTQKPVALAEWGFERAGLKPGQLVFAPYLGSGPEVRAALNMGLRIIGCEVDADYCRTVVEHRVALAAPKRGQEGQVLLAF